MSLPTIPKQFISEIKIQDIPGRMVVLPPHTATQSRHILVIYGHHSSLERMYSTAQSLQDFGTVCMPDLPGFGGMPSLSSSNITPSVDTLADYLAVFVKTHYRNKRFTIFGMSFGFVVATRMLQRHPELQKQVEMLISFVGFTHHKDFKFKARNYLLLKYTAKSLSRHPLPAKILAKTIIQRPFIATAYHLRSKTHPKMKGFSYSERKNLIDFEVILWQSNELYTYFATGHEMLTLDLTKMRIAAPVHHIAVAADQYFDNDMVQKHMKKIFSSVTVHQAVMENHAPTIIDGVDAAKKIIPQSIRDILQ